MVWGGGLDEMQNKAEAQSAWLQLAAGAYLSLAKTSSPKYAEFFSFAAFQYLLFDFLVFISYLTPTIVIIEKC